MFTNGISAHLFVYAYTAFVCGICTGNPIPYIVGIALLEASVYVAICSRLGGLLPGSYYLKRNPRTYDSSQGQSEQE